MGLFINNISEIRTKQIEGIDFYKSNGISKIVFDNSDGYVDINDIKPREVSIKSNIISVLLENSGENFEYKKYFKGISKTLSFEHKVKIAFDDLMINIKNEYGNSTVNNLNEMKSLFKVDSKENYVTLVIKSVDLRVILNSDNNISIIKDNNIEKSNKSNFKEFIIK